MHPSQASTSTSTTTPKHLRPKTTTTTTTPSPPLQPRPSVTNFDLGSLIEQNNLSEDSCLLVVDNKVYDLTLCLQDHLSCNLQHAPLADDNEPADSPRTSPRSSDPPSPPPSPLLQRSIPPAAAASPSQPEPQPPNRFDELLQTAKRDPVQAGHLLRSIYDDQPFRADGSPLHDWLSDFRIGDFNLPSASTPTTYLNHSWLDQGPSRSLAPSISSSRSTNTAGPPIHRPTPAAQPSHLDRANELVRLSKQRVIDAQRGVGVANLSLADAFAQLVEAEKVKDHLVLQASEGYRPIWPAWLNENNQ
ncbi:hypothetical protein PTTG_02355 [Puccinia triticina 1-1 BBBD Race 1]|uniref:Cytochrome b5 heme-binding domain-containing protein n=1 Tax=Puccinia triticina (isolate 1-1 / race 1 (BBBD)) TaxID=630390 RepID=A0A180H3L6_PUCT1|nr:hypothetical protein PTTG_02355 [Puccinia triticina 1-1 BBBD Race 1]